MTWLYVPSACAPASAVSTSVSGSLDPTRAASLSWRGKPQQPQAWSRAWKRGGFIRLLSGLTCEPSTLERGAAQWIASCREIPARETASPGNASAPMTTGGCSTARSRSSIKAGLLCSSARTYRGTSPDSSKSPSPHWSDWGAALRAEYSARARPARATDASGSSSWPTATVMSQAQTADKPTPGQTGGTTLAGAAETWMTPKVHEFVENPATRAARLAKIKPSDRPGAAGSLEMQARAWATPTARMHKGGGNAVTRADGKSRLDMLDWQAEAWSTPKASDGEKGGPNMRGSKGDLPLPAQAAQWATPAAQRFEAKDLDRMFKRQAECKAKGKSGNGFGLTLDNQVQVWPSAPLALHPDLPIPDGPPSLWPIPFSPLPSAISTSGDLLAEISALRRWSERSGGAAGWSGTWTRKVRRRLNPRFAGWLMGWPEGLSGFDTAGMASCLSPQPSLGCGCMNCWLTKQRTMLSDLLAINPPAQASFL